MVTADEFYDFPQTSRPLNLAMAFSIALHVFLMLISFAPPEPIKFKPMDSRLEVILLNAKGVRNEQTQADVIAQVEAVDRAGNLVRLGVNDIGFAYRSSTLPDDLTIVSATLKGPKDAPEAIHQRMEEGLRKRAETQPVKDRSCGSTFRNPAGFSSTGAADDVHDLKAWKLIDDAGLRGARLGGAQMSEMHPNFLINADGATADDLESLGEKVRNKVFEKSGIRLEWEIKRVGNKTP